jgi:hypothetical protein
MRPSLVPYFHPFDDTAKLCRKLISAHRLALTRRSGDRNALTNEPQDDSAQQKYALRFGSEQFPAAHGSKPNV